MMKRFPTLFSAVTKTEKLLKTMTIQMMSLMKDFLMMQIMMMKIKERGAFGYGSSRTGNSF